MSALREEENLGWHDLPLLASPPPSPAELRARQLQRRAGCLWLLVALMVVGYFLS